MDPADSGNPRTDVEVAVVDMAGTTVDENGAIPAAVECSLARLGRDSLAHDELQRLRGSSKLDMFRALVGDEEQALRAHSYFVEEMTRSIEAGRLVPRPGAVEALGDLREAGTKICLATGLSGELREHLLAQLGWRELVDLALSPEDAGRGRPHPDVNLTAALRLRASSVHALVVVGDTVNDLLAGHRAGARWVVGVLGGAGSRTELECAPHSLLAESIRDLVPALVKEGATFPGRYHREG